MDSSRTIQVKLSKEFTHGNGPDTRFLEDERNNASPLEGRPTLRTPAPIITAVALKTYKGNPWSFSFNVTDRCPIGCNCYGRAQPRVKELSDDSVVAIFQGMRRQGFVHATLIGGEPYVNPATFGMMVRLTTV